MVVNCVLEEIASDRTRRKIVLGAGSELAAQWLFRLLLVVQ
jgi:hypothetical protein